MSGHKTNLGSAKVSPQAHHNNNENERAPLIPVVLIKFDRQLVSNQTDLAAFKTQEQKA
jgi:hypothetical protein